MSSESRFRLSLEVQLVRTEPRTFGEILAAEAELADKISYVRKLI